MSKTIQCIIVDDEPIAREILENHLRKVDSIKVVATCKNAVEAFNEINKNNKNQGLLELTIGFSGSDIERGTKVSLLKAINTELLTYDLFYNSLKLVGGTAIHVERQENLSDTKKIFMKSSKTKQEKRNMKGPPEI